MKKKPRDEYWKYDMARKAVGRELKLVCRKICYPSRKAAKAAVKRTLATPNADPNGHALRPYYCRACEFFHIGHDRHAITG